MQLNSPTTPCLPLLFALSISLILPTTSQLMFTFKFPNSSKTIQTFGDFSYPFFLIDATLIDCESTKHCQLIDKEVKTGVYQNVEYIYQTAKVNFEIRNLTRHEKHYVDHWFEVRLNDYVNVLGLNGESTIRDALQRGREFEVDLKEGRLAVQGEQNADRKRVF